MKSLPSSNPKLFRVSDAAKYLGVSPITMRRWDREGKLPSHRTLGNSRRYSKADLDNFVSKQKEAGDISNKRELDISETASILGVTTKTLRNWEKLGKISSLRDKNNYRVYDKNAVQNLTRVTEKVDHLIEPLIELNKSLEKTAKPNSFVGKLLSVRELALAQYKLAHFHIKKTHLYLGVRFHWYSRWHRFKYHPHVHWAALTLYFLGVVTGVYLALSGGLSFPIHADVAASASKGTDTEFSQGTLNGTAVSGSGAGAVVQLSGTPGPGGTQYKRSITVDNSTNGSILTDYQIVITMDTSSLVSAGKLQSNCADLRFNDADDTTALSYWVESGCNTVSSRIWIKIPTIAANSTKTIYLYYGSSSASAQSSGNNTFVFFDDFSGGSIDTAKWDLLGSASSYFSGISGELKAGEGVSGWSKGLASKTTYTRADLSVEFKLRWTSNNSSYDAFMFGWHDSGLGSSYADLVYAYYNSGTGTCTTCSAYVYEDAANKSPIAGTWVQNTQYNVRVRMKSGGGAFYEQSIDGGNTWTTAYNSSYSTESNLKIGFALYSGIHMVDDVRIKKWTTTEPATSVGSESVVIQPSGTWESPTNSNVMDLVWNGGWGDGTGGSTAFSATVANVSTNATVSFAMRVATTAAGLSGASYTSLGTVNSGTTFTQTKTQLDTLGLGTGVNRYVQVKATLDQTNGVNPALDGFTLNYMADNTAPATNGTAIAMQKTSGGATVTSGGWANNLAPYFSWTAGSDSQSGIKGYCLYVGTDNTADPVTTKGLLGTSPITGACPFIIGTSNIDFATASYRGGSWLTSSSSNYYITLKAVDQAGNIFTGVTTQFQFKFDNTEPTNPLFISAPSQFVATKTVTVTWPTTGGSAALDANSGLAGMQYKIGNSGIWYGVNHSGTQDQTDLLDVSVGQYTTSNALDQVALQEGSNLIYFRTWDLAGNASAAYVNTVIKINTTSPSTPRNVTATPNINTANSFAFSWIAPATFTGQASNLTYCYTVNTLPSISSCSFTSAGLTSLPAGAYATQPGDNTFYLVAKDEAGNINYATAGSVTFTANTSAPGVPLNIDIADISVKSTANWKLAITWEAPISLGAGVANYKISRSTNNSTFTEVASTSGVSYVDTNLTPVNYYYKVKACDSANNCGVFSSVVNKTPTGKYTEPAILSAEPKIEGLGTRSVTINWVTDRGSDSRISFGLASGSYFGAEVSNSNQVTDHSISINNLTAGTRYYYISRWTDEDGNTGTSTEFTFTTKPPPTISEVSARNINLTSAIIQFTEKNASKVNILFGKSSDFGGLKVVPTSLSESTLTVELTGLDDGTKYYYKLNSFDEAGNGYDGNVYSFSTLPRPKISNLRFDTVAGEPTSTLKINWDTNVPTSSVVSYTSTGGVKAESFDAELKSSHEVIIRGLTDNTRYTMAASGRDSLGNLVISDSNTFQTALDTRPPKISDLTIETSIQGNGSNSAQFIVSWKTDEPSSSQVEYGEGIGGSYTSKTVEDTNLVTDHIVIVSKLSPSKTYHVRASSFDRQRNNGLSGDNTAVTGRASQNVLETIVNSLQRSFGFLGGLFGGNN